MKTCVLFDLDGTLLDTLLDLTDCVNHALEVFGYPPRTSAEIRSFLGNGARELIRCAVPQEYAYEPVFDFYTDWYRDHSQIKTAPYPGILEALHALRGQYGIGVVSNKPDPATKALVKEYFGDLYALGQRDDIPKKPAADMLQHAMKALGADRCIYVGDSDVDVITAKNAGCPCVSVTWGFRDVEELLAAGAANLCDDAADLPAIIDQIANS